MTDTSRRLVGARQAASLSGLVLAASLGVMLEGCDKKPGGQVVAVVNSEDVTEQEVRAEAEAAGVPANQDFSKYAPAILDRVIERNLLADYAKDKNLNRGPEFIARRRQIEQALLANLATRQILSQLPAPTPANIGDFIKANPQMFGGRERLTLDQVRFPTPQDPSRIKALSALGSIDAVVAKLKADKVQAARGATTLDTGSVESSVGHQVAGLPNGRLFDISINGVTFISAITGRTSAATPESSWSGPAATVFQRERAQKALIDTVKSARAKAKITYGQGYQPKVLGQ